MDVEGKWVVCNKDDAYWFSAVGYFFGKKLHESLSQPVGLINSSWGGTPVEFWTPREVISKREDMVASWKSLAYAQRSGWNIGNAYNAMIINLEASAEDKLDNIANAYNAEEQINVMRNNLRDSEIENIEQNSDSYVTSVYFMDLINELEKMGDFIINISQDLLKYKLKVTKL